MNLGSELFNSRRKTRESGQAVVIVLLAIGLFLFGAVAFAVDLSNMWFHRQAAQTAADAACLASAMDLLADNEGSATGNQGFSNGTGITCTTSSTAIPCKYANLNGYDSDGNNPGNVVSISFPSSVTGATAPPAGIAPTPFIRVDVLDHVQSFFSAMLTGKRSQDVRAFAVCGNILATAPIPILILDPRDNDGTTLSVQGTPSITINGGPTRSIQVNSDGSTAVNIGGSATIDLSAGGPSGTGSDLGDFGGPLTAPSGFTPGTTGHWISPAAPIGDPFAQVCAPGQSGCPQINSTSAPSIPSAPTVPSDEATRGCSSIPCSIIYKDHGCPDSGGCKLYVPGHYAANIDVKNFTAVFDPGLYYLDNGLTLDSNGTARPGTGTGDGSGGILFYFSGSSTISVSANSGKSVLDPFNTLFGPTDTSGNPYANDTTHTNTTFTNGVKCTSSSGVPTNLLGVGSPSPGLSLQGNIMLGECTGYYGDPLGTNDPNGIQRGFLFFQDRSAEGVNPNWGGGGQFLLAGTMYFHSCNSSGTGTSCNTTSNSKLTKEYYSDNFTLTGNSGSGTYVLGDIVTDILTLGGTSGITMDLNPTVAFSILKATLIR